MKQYKVQFKHGDKWIARISVNSMKAAQAWAKQIKDWQHREARIIIVGA